MHRLAPHLCVPEKMILPLVEGGTLGKYSTSLALRVYDFLAGVKKEDRRKMLSKKATLTKEPLLNDEKLVGGGYYAEYRTDDARLTIELIKKAIAYGALALNYLEVTSYLYEGDQISGVVVTDHITGSTAEIRLRRLSQLLALGSTSSERSMTRLMTSGSFYLKAFTLLCLAIDCLCGSLLILMFLMVG